MVEPAVFEPQIVTIVGTHSSGKTTLISDLEAGKLTELGIDDPEGQYDDFGYGFFQNEHGRQPIITVPEAASWFANLHARPDFLAENYSLGFQVGIDAQVVFRIHTAANLARAVTARLLERGEIPASQAIVSPVIVSDRGPLDGIVYSQLRLPYNTNIVNGSPRMGIFSEWLKSFVGLVVVADYHGVPFEPAENRLSGLAFRAAVGETMLRGYQEILGEDVVRLSGDRKQRTDNLRALLSSLASRSGKDKRALLPYSAWGSVELATPHA